MTAGWRVDITAPARRDLRRVDPPVRRRVLDALDRLVADPSTGGSIKLQGRPEHRLCVGDWRVIIRLDDEQATVYVLRVLPRGRGFFRWGLAFGRRIGIIRADLWPNVGSKFGSYRPRSAALRRPSDAADRCACCRAAWTESRRA